MSSYAVSVEHSADDAAVRAWFGRVGERLANPRPGVLITGAVRDLGDGLYAVHVRTVVDQLWFTVGTYMFMLVGLGLGLAVGFSWFPVLLLFTGFVLFIVVEGLLSPGTQIAIMQFTLWRLTGRHLRIRNETEKVMRMVALGKV